jgi:hypothetical protein
MGSRSLATLTHTSFHAAARAALRLRAARVVEFANDRNHKMTSSFRLTEAKRDRKVATAAR